MTETYRTHSDICALFYQLTLDPEAVTQFILNNVRISEGTKALFVGGMFEIAKTLNIHGADVTVIDYTPEMVAIGKKALPKLRVEQADLRVLPYQNEFDTIFVIGRVFTHMISDLDLDQALSSCRSALRAGGYLFFDNYEDSKIQVTNYFNGTVRAQAQNVLIERHSRTTLLTSSPYVVSWHARYVGNLNGRNFDFSDTMQHRAWSRSEIVPFLENARFKLEKQGQNFDETSFFTLAQAI